MKNSQLKDSIQVSLIKILATPNRKLFQVLMQQLKTQLKLNI